MDNVNEILFFIVSIQLTVLVYFLSGKIFFSRHSTYNIYETSLKGIILISFFSLLINFIFPLNEYVNFFFSLVLISLYFLIFKKISINDIKKITYISVLSIILIMFDTVNRPDAYLYHFPYSQILNESKIIVGIGNIHFRFSHTSILQYLSSFNYNFLIKEKGLLIPAAVFWSTTFLYILSKIFKVKKENIYFDKIFLIIIFLFICTRINRYGEFGNDAIGHLTLFILTYKFLNLKQYNYSIFRYTLMLSAFAFLNKSFLIFAFIIPLYILIKLKVNFYKIFFNFPILLLLIWLIKNLLISGCLIYPVEYTCVKKFSWTDTKEVKFQKIQGEAWAKGWPDQKGSKLSHSNFIKKFKWFDTWKENNLKIFMKNFLILFAIIFTTNYLISYSKLNYDFFYKKIVLIILLIIGTYFYLTTFPIYRYGYSYLVIFFTICLSLIFNHFKKKYDLKLKNPIKFIVILGLCIITTKQIVKIINVKPDNTFIPRLNFVKSVEELGLKRKYLSDKFYIYQTAGLECQYFKAPCTNLKKDNLISKSKFSYNIISIKD